MHSKLPNPPLVEAICEVRLDPAVAWDLTIAGRLFEKLQPAFPQKRQTLGLELKLNAAGVPDPVDYRQLENLQFLSEDSKNVVQLREHSVSFSRLAPYESWERYKPSALDVIEKFRTVSGEGVIARVGLKYVNRVAIPKTQIRLEDYFDIYPHLGDKLPQSHGPFLVGVVFPYDDFSNSLQAEITSADPDKPSHYHVIFSLDYYTAGGEKVTFDILPSWLETAHDRLEDVFYATLKEPTIKLFG